MATVVDRTGEVVDDRTTDSHRTESATYRWAGFIYVPGLTAGAASVRHIAEVWEQQGQPPFQEIRGSFSLFAHFDDRKVAFADNSGLHTIYVHRDAVSDSFLQLVSHLRERGTAMSFQHAALAQSFSIGRILTDQTVIEGIEMLDKDEFVEVRDGRISIAGKNIPGIQEPRPGFTPSGFFDDLSTAVRADGAVSCALTGGYDSRMVYAHLKNRVPVVPTLSGDRPITRDARTAIVAARAAGSELDFVVTGKPDVSAHAVERAFIDSDGATGFFSDSSLRLADYYRQLSRKGITLHLTGDGGVLHKDWEWIQDFPFYRKKSTNLKKFYAQRLAFNFDDTGAGPTIRRSLNEMRSVTLDQISRFIQSTNSQSYDMLYFHVNGRRTALYNAAIGGISLYAPLLERDFVAYSYALPRRLRFFNNNIRRLTTRENPRLARVRTVYGMTASSEKAAVARDAVFQLIDYARRFIRLVARRTLGRTPLLEDPTEWTLTPELQQAVEAKAAVQYCQALGLIDGSESAETLSRRHLEFALEVHRVGTLAGVAVAKRR